MRTFSVCLLFAASLSCAPASNAYAPDQHQALTFVAARAVNRCLDEIHAPRLTALQVRYLVRANVDLADSNMFVRLFRWNYYNRAGGERSWLGMVDTRLHEHFNDLLLELEDRRQAADRYTDLGRIISYLQDVSTPSRAVPVFANRFWRMSFTDRFDNFPVDPEAVEEAVLESCDYVLQAQADLDDVLSETANDTLTAVQAPIFGMPATWEAFWKLADEDEAFGDYGPAGNAFGRETEFACGEDSRCVLLDDDPLYRNFARERHIAAVLATMRAMIVMQRVTARPEGSVDPN